MLPVLLLAHPGVLIVDAPDGDAAALGGRDDFQILLEDELVQGRLGGPVGALDVQFGDTDDPAGVLQVRQAGYNLVLQVGRGHIQVHLGTDAGHLRVSFHVVAVGFPLGVDRLEVVVVQIQDGGLTLAGQRIGGIGERLVHPVLGTLEILPPDEDFAGGVPRRAEFDGPVRERLVHDVPTVRIEMLDHLVHPVPIDEADGVVHQFPLQARAGREGGGGAAARYGRRRRGRSKLDIVQEIGHRFHTPVEGEGELGSRFNRVIHALVCPVGTHLRELVVCGTPVLGFPVTTDIDLEISGLARLGIPGNPISRSGRDGEGFGQHLDAPGILRITRRIVHFQRQRAAMRCFVRHTHIIRAVYRGNIRRVERARRKVLKVDNLGRRLLAATASFPEDADIVDDDVLRRGELETEFAQGFNRKGSGILVPIAGHARLRLLTVAGDGFDGSFFRQGLGPERDVIRFSGLDGRVNRQGGAV